MRDKRYRRWDEILNPALERSLEREHKNPYEKEILRALETDMREAGDRVGIVTGRSSEEQRSSGKVRAEDRGKAGKKPAERAMKPGAGKQKNAEEREKVEIHPHRALSGGQTGIGDYHSEVSGAGTNRGKKKTELEGLLEEFIRWKESMQN